MNIKWLLILSLTPLLSMAQSYQYIPMPIDSAIWSEIYRYDAWSPWTNYRWAVFGDDTVWQGNTYTKIYKLHTMEYDKTKAHVVAGMREINKRVYLVPFECLYPGYEHQFDTMSPIGPPFVDHEFLQYDFNLNIGDTIQRYYSFDWEPEQYCFVIQTIDTISFNDQLLRKRFDTDFYSLVKYIESIGSSWGFIFPYGAIENTGVWNRMVCQIVKGETVFHLDGFSDCFPYYTEVYENKNNAINLTPNPCTNKLYVSTYFARNMDYKIINCFGKYLIQGTLEEFDASINVSNLETGIYIIQIYNKKELFVKTFIKL